MIHAHRSVLSRISPLLSYAFAYIESLCLFYGQIGEHEPTPMVPIGPLAVFWGVRPIEMGFDPTIFLGGNGWSELSACSESVRK